MKSPRAIRGFIKKESDFKIMIFTPKIIPLTLLVLGNLIVGVNADTVYLNNGRSIEGFLVNEDEQGIVLEVGFGTIKIEKNQIVKIDKSLPEESIAIYQEWKERKLAADKREAQIRLRKENEQIEAPTSEESSGIVKEEPRKESQPQNIEVNQKGRHIFVDAILNNKIHVSLMLDTGASLVVLSKEIGRQLGINTDVVDPEDKAGMITMVLADGNKTQAKYVRLESVKVEGAEVENVGAAVLLDDQVEPGFNDGLLGMSFLNKFNFKVDRENNRLILESIE